MKRSAAKKFIPYGRQSISPKDIRAVTEALRSDHLTTGPRVRQFEEKLAAYCGARFAVVCSSGTAALHLACLALGLKEKDAIVTSPITFLATANCARYVGAEVAFSDIDERTANLDPAKLSQTLGRTRRAKAVFPVHFAGQPADMESISRIARAKGLKIVEDACHALGASYKTKNGQTVKVGSCRHSDMSVFSFHPIKTITTGEGGAVTTNDEKLRDRLFLFRNHGMQKKEGVGPWYYEMSEMGFNYRLTDIQCALGISQLERADFFVRQRRKIARFYDESFAGSSTVTPLSDLHGAISSRHLYAVRINFKKLGQNRSGVMRALAWRGIGTQVHYIPVHLQPYYKKRYGARKGDLPAAEKYYEEALSLPLYPLMTMPAARKVTQEVGRICGQGRT